MAPVRSLAGFLAGASVVGFSGSRVSGGPLCVAARGACASVPPGVPVSVGCASGVDAVVRGAFPRATVFAVSSGRWGSGRGAFARRSAALVRSLLPGGVLVVLPLGPCPGVVSPSPVASRCWCGGGSSGASGGYKREANAVCRSGKGETQESEGYTIVTATQDDFEAAKGLYESRAENLSTKLTDRELHFIRWLREKAKNNPYAFKINDIAQSYRRL